MAGVLLLVGVCAPPGVWEYDAAWAARHPTDHDAIARAVAPDIFSPPPLGVPLGGPAFNASFANPCWHEEGTRKLRCLPAFYLIGGFQCAVHDLGRRIALSADAVTPANMFHAFWSSGAGFGGDWGRFVRLMDKAVPRIQRQPRSALAFIANPAMLAFTWAEHARVHDSFARTVGACWKRCRKELQPSEVAELCKDKKYKLDHCLRLAYEQDPASAVGPAGVEFTLPQLMRRAHGANVKLVALLRNPADRLWSAFFSYGQFRGKYGDGEAGVAAYFAEQSAAFARCASRYDRRTCALRLESLGQAWQDIFCASEAGGARQPRPSAGRHASGCCRRCSSRARSHRPPAAPHLSAAPAPLAPNRAAPLRQTTATSSSSRCTQSSSTSGSSPLARRGCCSSARRST